MYREPEGSSVTQWVADLKDGGAEAARRLAERYWQRLEALARSKLGTFPRRDADEEDIVVSVFEALCRGAAAGKFSELSNREDLWWLLLALTRRKTVDHVRRQTSQKRGGKHTFVETNPENGNLEPAGYLDQLVSSEPTPEFLVSLEEEHERLLMLLRDDTLRCVAIWRMEGYSNQEIADRLGIGLRAVERKLALIRKKWEREFSNDSR